MWHVSNGCFSYLELIKFEASDNKRIPGEWQPTRTMAFVSYHHVQREMDEGSIKCDDSTIHQRRTGDRRLATAVGTEKCSERRRSVEGVSCIVVCVYYYY